jgi:putative toxin-antitoxin system antitoxin component (TIGR02293 family)
MKMDTKVSPAAVIATVRQGFPLRELENLRDALALPIEQVAAKVGMSKATFHRRKLEGRLTQDESDKVLRYARLMGHAISIFGSEENARQWLNAPQRGLCGSVPLDYAETEVGAREVEYLLGRIEYGVYS